MDSQQCNIDTILTIKFGNRQAEVYGYKIDVLDEESEMRFIKGNM